MKYEMPALTDAQREELIAYAEGMKDLLRHDKTGSNNLLMLGNDIILAALTAEVVGEVVEMPASTVLDRTLGIDKGYKEVSGRTKMRRMPVGTKFYATPPVPVLQIPAGISFASEWTTVDDPIETSAEVRGFNRAIAEVKRLNGLN